MKVRHYLASYSVTSQQLHNKFSLIQRTHKIKSKVFYEAGELNSSSSSQEVYCLSHQGNTANSL